MTSGVPEDYVVREGQPGLPPLSNSNSEKKRSYAKSIGSSSSDPLSKKAKITKAGRVEEETTPSSVAKDILYSPPQPKAIEGEPKPSILSMACRGVGNGVYFITESALKTVCVQVLRHALLEQQEQAVKELVKDVQSTASAYVTQLFLEPGEGFEKKLSHEQKTYASHYNVMCEQNTMDRVCRELTQSMVGYAKGEASGVEEIFSRYQLQEGDFCQNMAEFDPSDQLLIQCGLNPTLVTPVVEELAQKVPPNIEQFLVTSSVDGLKVGKMLLAMLALFGGNPTRMAQNKVIDLLSTLVAKTVMEVGTRYMFGSQDVSEGVQNRKKLTAVSPSQKLAKKTLSMLEMGGLAMKLGGKTMAHGVIKHALSYAIDYYLNYCVGFKAGQAVGELAFTGFERFADFLTAPSDVLPPHVLPQGVERLDQLVERLDQLGIPMHAIQQVSGFIQAVLPPMLKPFANEYSLVVVSLVQSKAMVSMASHFVADCLAKLLVEAGASALSVAYDLVQAHVAPRLLPIMGFTPQDPEGKPQGKENS